MNLADIARGELLDGLPGYLRSARLAKGWSLRKAEAETGIPNGHISQVETGKITDPSWRVVTALELAYGVAPFEYAGK